MKKDIGKSCDFHKHLWENTDECHSKKYLVAEIKENNINPDSEYYSENNGRKKIINTKPTSTIVTTKIQLEEPTDPEEGELFFHSHM
jgi:hypothetical protein